MNNDVTSALRDKGVGSSVRFGRFEVCAREGRSGAFGSILAAMCAYWFGGLLRTVPIE